MHRKAFPLLATVVLAASVGAMVLATGACGGNGGANADPEIAATVNGKEIPVSEIDRLIDLQLKQAGPTAPQLTPISLTAARLQILDQLITEEVLFQRAQKENVVPNDDELNQKIAQQKQGYGMTEDQFQKFLQQSGQTEQQFREQIRRQLAIEKLRDKVAARVPSPKDEEVRKFFEENKAQLVAPRGFELSVITVDPRDNGASDDARSDQESQAKAQRILASLRAGGDFATVAQQQSEDARSAMQGGLIGFYSEQQAQETFGPDIARNFFNMQPGQITDPIRSPDGRWFIFKLNNKREQQREMTYEEVQQQIAQQITDQRKQVVLSALMIDAVSASAVKNHLATRILEHPDTFGALRPSPLTERKPEQAPATNAPANVNTTPPANANAAPAANTNSSK